MASSDLSPEAVGRVKADVMTFAHDGALLVLASDYAELHAALTAAESRAERAEKALAGIRENRGALAEALKQARTRAVQTAAAQAR